MMMINLGSKKLLGILIDKTPPFMPPAGGRGGGTFVYKVYRYVPPQMVWFLSHFGLKTGIDFEHFGLKLGMVIRGTFTKAH